MTYQQALRYLNSFTNCEKTTDYSYSSFKIGRIRAFLKSIDSPQKNLKAIHVAGTNGKGSTCAFVAYILREAGFSAGLFTSPHLRSLRERIRILSDWDCARRKADKFEGIISKYNFTEILSDLRPAIERFNRTCGYSDLTFFEILTAIALVYFKNKKTDFIILETGLGGRLDATNVVRPLLCLITSIGLEHEEILGKTLEKIAKEKAGIIKKINNLRVISDVQQSAAAKVVQDRCAKLGVALNQIGKDISFEPIRSNLRGQSFNLATRQCYYPGLYIKLLGRYQLHNASLAVSAMEGLRGFGFKISTCSIRRGLSRAYWPGRLELINRQPPILLDAAHNKDAVVALTRALRTNLDGKPIHIIFGVSRDKKIEAILKEIADVSDSIILTRSDNTRAADVALMLNILEKIKSRQKYRFSFYVREDYRQAVNFAKKLAKKNGFIVVTGSVFLVGDVRGYICKDSPV